ncbi:hypothetical protein E4U22_001894 [Claviceps purpurea]|nr:hypothetical protein E4U22_001894 [Claviceps purpurea]
MMRIDGNRRVRYTDAVSQEKSARSAENKDAAVHQKENDIAVPGHDVVEVQQISTEPAEDILVPMTHMPKKNRSRTKKGKNAGVGPSTMRAAAGPSKVVKPGFAAKLTKRGKRLATLVSSQSQTEGEGLLSNGKHLVFRPPPTKKEIDDGAMVEIVMDSLEGGVVPESVSPVKAQVWAVSFTTTEDAKACVGKGIKFEVKHGCTSPLEIRGTENAVLTATNKDDVVCLKGKGTTVPKNDVVQKKPTRQAEDKDAAVHQKGKGVAVPKHDDAVSQEKSARSAENKDAAVHQKKNDIAVPGHNVVEVQQISTEPAEDILVPKTPGTNHQYRGTAINHVGRIPEWQQVLVRCAQKTRSRRGQTSPGPGGNHDDGFPGSERIRTTIQARES